MPVSQTHSSELTITGDLKFPVIVQLRKETEAMLKQMEGEVTLNFEGVTSVDSSALSFWLCCQRLAKKEALSLTASAVPAEMMEFASLVGLDKELA